MANAIVNIEEKVYPIVGIEIVICSDSTICSDIVRYAAAPGINVQLAHAVRRAMNDRNDKNKTTINWVAGHADIELNERVDKLAKTAAETSKLGNGLTHQQLKNNIAACSFAPTQLAT